MALVLLKFTMDTTPRRIEPARGVGQARQRGEALLKERYLKPGQRHRFDFYEVEPYENAKAFFLSMETYCPKKRRWDECPGWAEVCVIN